MLICLLGCFIVPIYRLTRRKCQKNGTQNFESHCPTECAPYPPRFAHICVRGPPKNHAAQAMGATLTTEWPAIGVHWCSSPRATTQHGAPALQVL